MVIEKFANAVVDDAAAALLFYGTEYFVSEFSKTEVVSVLPADKKPLCPQYERLFAFCVR